MNPTVVAYIGFVVAVLIFIWAIFEMRSRLTRHKKINADTWVKLHPTPVPDAKQEELIPLPEEDIDDQEEKSVQDFHIRAQQNGHYSQSKKPT